MIARFDVLIAASLVTAPSWWSAMNTGDIDWDAILTRYLLAVAACAVAMSFFRRMFNNFVRKSYIDRRRKDRRKVTIDGIKTAE